MSTRRSFLLQAAATAAAASTARAGPRKGPVRIAIVGLVHDHVRGFLPTVVGNPEVELCGIAESNLTLFDRYATQFHLKPSLRFDSLDRLLSTNRIDALATFTTTLDHRAVVDTAAAHRVHVMMEKPLATNLADGRSMAAVARKAGIEITSTGPRYADASSRGHYSCAFDSTDCRRAANSAGSSGCRCARHSEALRPVSAGYKPAGNGNSGSREGVRSLATASVSELVVRQ
jgi:hypothetical protein